MVANAEQQEWWSGERGRAWIRCADQFDAQLAVYADRLLGAAAPKAGERVLDVGCGSGVTSLAAAEAVGPTGRVVGLDISPTMLEVARDRAHAAGWSNLEFACDDAQTSAPVIEADVVISRFGVMFFDDPVAAFSNVADMTLDGGRLAFVCWGPVAENSWMFGPGLAVSELVPMPPAALPGAPGPFAFADSDRVRDVLTAGGWTDVSVVDLDDDIYLGGPGSVDEAIEFVASSSALATAVTALSEADRAAARRLLAEEFAPHHDGTGVRYGALARLVTARRSSR